MIDKKLAEYISELKIAGIDDSQIKKNLIQGGWDVGVVEEAFDSSDNTKKVNIPVPPVPRLGMWISFEYVLLFVTLWVWTGALGGIWNYAINKHMIDPLANSVNSHGYLSSNYGSVFLQGYLAAIIVTYPIFASLFGSIETQIDKNPEIRNIKMRKVLMYITLVANFLYLISTTISTIYSYLNATASITTIPHLLVNLIISGSICSYLMFELREDRKNII